MFAVISDREGGLEVVTFSLVGVGLSGLNRKTGKSRTFTIGAVGGIFRGTKDILPEFPPKYLYAANFPPKNIM